MINEIFFSLIGITGGTIVEGDNCFIVNDEHSFLSEPDKFLLEKVAEIGYNYKVLRDFVSNFNDLAHKEQVDDFYTVQKEASKQHKKDNDIDYGLNSNLKNTENKNAFAKNTNQNPFNDMDDNEEQKEDELQAKYLSIYLYPIKEHITEYLNTYEDKVAEIEQSFYLNDFISKSDIISELSMYNETFIRVIDFVQFILNNELKSSEILDFLYNALQQGDLIIKQFFKELYINVMIYILKIFSEFIIESNLDFTHNEFFIVTSNMTDADELHTWNTNFYIEKSNIPSFFPIKIVEISLYIAKCIKILKNEKNFKKISLIDLSNYNTILLESIIFDKETSLISELIDFNKFEEGLTKLKIIIGKEIWNLFNIDYKMIPQMKIVKNILLTFEGQIFHNFVSKIIPILNDEWDNRIEKELNEKYFKQTIIEYCNKNNKKVDNSKYDKINFQPFSLNYLDDLSLNSTAYDINDIYSNFNIKLVSSGFDLNFKPEHINDSILKNKDIIFFGNILHDTYSNSMRFMNTVYKKQNTGALWNLNHYDIDNDFYINFDFIIKNFSKKGLVSLNDSSQQLLTGGLLASKDKDNLKSSFAKKTLRQSRAMDLDSQNSSVLQSQNKFSNFKIKEKSLVKALNINFILHIANDFDNKQASNLDNLSHYVLIQLCFKYDYNVNTRPNELQINIKFKDKKSNDINIVHHQSIDLNTYPDYSFLCNDVLSNISFSYQSNQLIFTSRYSKDFKITIPFNLSNLITKNKHKVICGLVLSSENIDIILEFQYLSSKFYCGEIFNENINLIIFDYIPCFPLNFIYHESIRKCYNQLFNLIFPVKTCLILMNQLWLDKKAYNNINYTENYEILNKKTSAIHSEFISFLNNLITFYMFDIIEQRYNIMFKQIIEKEDLEELFILHEAFISDVLGLSFVKSKKIMKIIFEILSIIRKFYILIKSQVFSLFERLEKRTKDIKLDNEYKIIMGSTILNNSSSMLKNESIANNEDDNLNFEIQSFEKEIEYFRNEFKSKTSSLISTLLKIKNSKYFQVISLLLTKIDHSYNQQSFSYDEFN